MSEGSNSIRIVTTDEALLASTRAAVSGLEGWTLEEPLSVEEILGSNVPSGDVILLDAWQRSENVYESCRRLTGKTKCRTYVVTDLDNRLAEPIALFCGATGTLARPLSATALRNVIQHGAPRSELATERRDESQGRDLPLSLMQALVGERSARLVDVLVDPETGLYSYDYLKFKLDEEFKRARRFDHALSCVMLGFEGQADEETLGALASIFLNASRDTDVLGRFDQSSFLFFLPNTGPDGAEIMASRIRAAAEEAALTDLVGDRLEIAVGISYFPHPEIEEREELFARARDAFHSGQRDGGVVVRAD
ncbi:MAG: GGDEF domain-containing protein [Planctomycetota bacterium]